jgi:transglutaminase-like putative cysteine protease
MAALAVLGTCILGVGQPDLTLPLLMLTVAVTSVYLTDIKGWLRLNRLAASVGALTAAVIALSDIGHKQPDQQLIAIAHLLVYLQIVLLYQEKNARVYWQLVMMSLLQVVVAAVLSLSLLFGVLLVLYLILALGTLAVFFLCRETRRYPVSALVGTPPEASEWAVGGHSGEPQRFYALDASRGALRVSQWGLVSTTCKMVCATLVVTVVVFFAIPRYGGTPWRGNAANARHVVGFSQQVTLGDLGMVATDPGLVMRVQFVDAESDQPIELKDELLLRGSVVTTYSSDDRQWSLGNWHFPRDSRQLPPAPLDQPITQQIITLEPLSEPVVFCVYPPYRLGPSPAGIRFDWNRQQLVRSEEQSESQMNIKIATTSIRDEMQLNLVPTTINLDHAPLDTLLRMPVVYRHRKQVDPFTGLAEVARRALAEAGVEARDRIRAAQALEAYLKRPGLFTYSLGNTGPTPAGVDPIEDFVTRRRRGHCEYFASALALMLRSQGIPSRIVIGFRGGDWNSIGRFYQVRQLHAHTWVEAYLERKDLGSFASRNDLQSATGAWLRLDPTPTRNSAGMSQVTGLLAGFGELTGYAELLWSNYVLGLNQQKQNDSIYNPVARTLTATLRGVFDANTRRQLIPPIASRIRVGLRTWLRGDWFSWRGGLVAMAICLIAAGLLHLLRILYRYLRSLTARLRRRRAGQALRETRFYGRLEQLLKRHGIVRGPGETQHEFAMAVGGHLAESPATHLAAHLPGDIADAFYRVRFGHVPLDREQVENVERALLELESAFRGRKRL